MKIQQEFEGRSYTLSQETISVIEMLTMMSIYALIERHNEINDKLKWIITEDDFVKT